MVKKAPWREDRIRYLLDARCLAEPVNVLARYFTRRRWETDILTLAFRSAVAMRKVIKIANLPHNAYMDLTCAPRSRAVHPRRAGGIYLPPGGLDPTITYLDFSISQSISIRHAHLKVQIGIIQSPIIYYQPDHATIFSLSRLAHQAFP